MAKETATIETIVPINVEVAKDDLVAAGVSKMERELRKRLREANAKLAEADKTVEAAARALDKAGQALADGAKGKYAEAALALSKLGKATTVEVGWHAREILGRNAGDDVKRFTCNVVLFVEHRALLEFHESIAVDAAAREARKAHYKAFAARQEAADAVDDLRMKLRRVPQMERIMKGRLAEIRLAQNPDGDKLLKSVFADLEKDAVLLLPGARD